MIGKNKRVLWLLNHKTLMPYEVPLLVSLGFEVFTPKVIPKTPDFRSGVVTFEYDTSLTIPAKALRRLNEFDFYLEEWPADIVALVNRYFGTVYVIPIGKQVPEAVRKFEGQVMFRAFGLDNSQTYERVLKVLYGSSIFRAIYAIRDRFWFAQGYEQLAEVELPLIAERSIFLPIGVPGSFWKTEDTWTGTDKRILFVCPNLVTNEYYREVYEGFKRDIGRFHPHVIVGAQDAPVTDPNVLGFVSNEELERLYQECALLYYHSKELRHVHYSPIEAAINGMPVIYYADSLLGNMTPDIALGRETSLAGARDSIGRVLDGDQAYVAKLRAEQRTLAHKFSDAYCRSEWIKGLERSGYNAALEKQAGFGETARSTLARVSKAMGLSSRKRLPVPPQDLLPSRTYDGTTIQDGIDFSQSEYPWFVDEVSGLSFDEPFGRWSNGPAIEIALREKLPKRFRLVIAGGGYGPNIGREITVRIGRATQSFVFRNAPGQHEEAVLEFSTWKHEDLIQIAVPEPVIPGNDNRAIGLALTDLRVEAL